MWSRFPDRRSAGADLAVKLAAVVPPPSVVAAIPRGGVIVAAASAALLGVPLVPLHAGRLAAPPRPEVSFGAVDEEGHTVVEYPLIAALRLDAEDLERAKARVCAELRRRRDLYGVPALSAYLPAETVALLDDGLATGLTMDAAVAYARRHGAQQVIVAAPCASPQAAARLRASADGFIALLVDPAFESIDSGYADFADLDDAEVLQALSQVRGRRPASDDR